MDVFWGIGVCLARWDSARLHSSPIGEGLRFAASNHIWIRDACCGRLDSLADIIDLRGRRRCEELSEHFIPLWFGGLRLRACHGWYLKSWMDLQCSGLSDPACSHQWVYLQLFASKLIFVGKICSIQYLIKQNFWLGTFLDQMQIICLLYFLVHWLFQRETSKQSLGRVWDCPRPALMKRECNAYFARTLWKVGGGNVNIADPFQFRNLIAFLAVLFSFPCTFSCSLLPLPGKIQYVYLNIYIYIYYSFPKHSKTIQFFLGHAWTVPTTDFWSWVSGHPEIPQPPVHQVRKSFMAWLYPPAKIQTEAGWWPAQCPPHGCLRHAHIEIGTMFASLSTFRFCWNADATSIK